MLDDDASALLRFENVASGVLVATQVDTGEENNLRLRIYGETGGLEWSHTDPNTLLVKSNSEPARIYRTGGGYVSSAAANNTRVPADRKSTRLNSSHVAISYAVSCLQQK